MTAVATSSCLGASALKGRCVSCRECVHTVIRIRGLSASTARVDRTRPSADRGRLSRKQANHTSIKDISGPAGVFLVHTYTASFRKRHFGSIISVGRGDRRPPSGLQGLRTIRSQNVFLTRRVYTNSRWARIRLGQWHTQCQSR